MSSAPVCTESVKPNKRTLTELRTLREPRAKQLAVSVRRIVQFTERDLAGGLGGIEFRANFPTRFGLGQRLEKRRRIGLFRVVYKPSSFRLAQFLTDLGARLRTQLRKGGWISLLAIRNQPGRPRLLQFLQDLLSGLRLCVCSGRHADRKHRDEKGKSEAIHKISHSE